MFFFNIIKNINKKSILYSISTLNISTNFGMNSEQGVFTIKKQKKNINLLTLEGENNSFLGRKHKNSLKKGCHDKFSNDVIRTCIFVKFSDYLLTLLNCELKEIKEECDIFEDFGKLEENIKFKKMKSFSKIVLADIYDILNSKLGYYCLTTSRKSDHNVKLIDKCILCEKACSNLCDIFCSYGYQIYSNFLDSDFYKNILVDIEQKNGYMYKNKFDKTAKTIISTILNENFKKKSSMNRKEFLDKNINEDLIDFFEYRINYYDEILNKEIDLKENYELDFINIFEREINLKKNYKLDFSELSEKEISNFKDIFNENCIDNK